MSAPGIQFVYQAVVPSHLRFGAKIIDYKQNVWLHLSLLGSAELDDCELLVNDFFHRGEIGLIKKELLAMMIWVSHVKNLVFNKVPNRLPHWVMVHAGAKHINAVKTRFTVFVSIHLCNELYKKIRFP